MVIDDQARQPVPEANIVVEGTTQDMATNLVQHGHGQRFTSIHAMLQ